MNDLTAALELRIIMNSVISATRDHFNTLRRSRELTSERHSPAPAWNPAPTPAVPIALGADHVPSFNLAITTPVPALALKTNPALTIVMNAKPFAFLRIDGGMTLSRPLTAIPSYDAKVSHGRERERKGGADRRRTNDLRKS